MMSENLAKFFKYQWENPPAPFNPNFDPLHKELTEAVNQKMDRLEELDPPTSLAARAERRKRVTNELRDHRRIER